MTQQAQSQDLEDMRRTFRSKLGWLKSLRSLVIITEVQGDRSGSVPVGYSPGDPFVKEFINLLFSSQDLLPHSLERLWIPVDYDSSRELRIEQLPAPLVTSLNLWEEDGVGTQLDHPKFKQVEHLGNIEFSDSFDQMQKLEYIEGLCVDNEVIVGTLNYVMCEKKNNFLYFQQGLSLFCKTHPDLLHLYFNTSFDGAHHEADYSIGDGDFFLPKLQTIGYFSTSGPSESSLIY